MGTVMRPATALIIGRRRTVLVTDLDGRIGRTGRLRVRVVVVQAIAGSGTKVLCEG